MIDRAAKNLNVGVVGGGLGGLAAACVLAARGHRVRLFEKNPWLGGKAPSIPTKASALTWAQRF